MNCVPPMNSKSLGEMNKCIADSYYFVAKESMQNAAKDLRSDTEDICDVAVSCDGSWQKRGFASLNGLVSVISVETGKALDYRVITKKCAQCSVWENHKDNEGYVEFMMKHESECLINHVCSAGKMECDGIVSCFESSIETHKLCYTEYLGDGDSKSYSLVVEKNETSWKV